MSPINSFDAGIISWLNHWAQRSWTLDTAVVLISQSLIRAAAIVPLVYWAWFRRDDKDNSAEKIRDRGILVFGMVTCLFSLFIARIISKIAPFRVRPLHDPDLHFVLPYGMNSSTLLNWNSFPSDHAAVYFTLAMCIYFVSKRAGLLALGYTFFVTCIPRVYLGLHYPTDILAGAALGIVMASLALSPAIRTALTGRILHWQELYPGLFYAGFFLYAVQLATAFELVRLLLDFLTAVTNHGNRIQH
jgi:undecaprenyl-diphosphatase